MVAIAALIAGISVKRIKTNQSIGWDLGANIAYNE
jgi:hypothetical protein